jgi:predicted HTH transcriptional regulator
MGGMCSTRRELMFIARKDLDQLTQDDLQQLIDNQVSESRTMEYKQALPSLHPPEKKREFLADVSSFANTVGGYIVFGMKAQDGVPVALTGLEGLNSDAAILQLDRAIRDGIAPRIQGIRWSPPIPLRNGNSALVLYIPQSADAPHMVTADTTSRFWARDTRGKYDMDVQQIRAAFLASDAVNQVLRRLREIRPQEIAAGKTPVSLAEGATVLM